MSPGVDMEPSITITGQWQSVLLKNPDFPHIMDYTEFYCQRFDMTKVTSAVFQKEFGRFRTRAHKEAVIITHHGRDDLALITADEYQRLCELDQQAFYPHELPEEVIKKLGTVPLPEEAYQFDHEYPAE